MAKNAKMIIVEGPVITCPLRILIVENHADTLRILRSYLESLGHTVSAVANKAEALREAAATPLDMLISDIGLADGNGWELLAEARFPQPVFAVAMSGFGMRSDQEKSARAGYRRHIRKPFDLDVLDEVLDEAATTVRGWRGSGDMVR
jgi:two-component system CheB/CheR fusion protein